MCSTVVLVRLLGMSLFSQYFFVHNQEIFVGCLSVSFSRGVVISLMLPMIHGSLCSWSPT